MKQLVEPLGTPETTDCDPVEDMQKINDQKSYATSVHRRMS
jgi:hypothetical protein